MKNKSQTILILLIGITLGFLITNHQIIKEKIDSYMITHTKKQSSYKQISKSYNSDIEVLFTPGDQCTKRIVDHILKAQKEILVQAYSFTSSPIIHALINQHKKGVKVTIILDKSQENSIYALKIQNAGINVYIDKLKGIAHNKVIIIDNKKVFTGSFNFSQAAQTRNAENSILIKNIKIVQQFKDNFAKRLKVSYLAKKNIKNKPRFFKNITH